MLSMTVFLGCYFLYNCCVATIDTHLIGEGKLLKVFKSLNNNMVLVKDPSGTDCICQGKGLGFQKKKGDIIDESLIERTYKLETEEESRHFQELFKEIPEEYWRIAIETADYGHKELEMKFSDHVVLPLCDHIAASCERCKESIYLTNPLLYEIQRVYPKEYQCGKYAIRLIQEQFGITMPDDDAAFIAYHFVNAGLPSNMVVSTDESVKLIGSVIDIVQQSFQIQLDTEDWNYQRFLTHLKFFASRILTLQAYEEPEDTDLFDELSERCKPVRNCVDKIADFILIDYHYDISSDEKMYLLIHIERVTRKFRKHGKKK